MRTRKPGRPASRRRERSGKQAPPLSEAARTLLAAAGPARRSRGAAAQPAHPPNLPDPFEGLVTPQQAAELFDVTTRTIRNWRKDGLLEPVLRPRGRVFYRLEELLRLFEPAKPTVRKPVKLK